MPQLTVLVLAAAWAAVGLGSTAEAATNANVGVAQEEQMYGDDMDLDESQRLIKVPNQLPVYQGYQGYYQQPEQSIQQQPAQGQYQQPVQPTQQQPAQSQYQQPVQAAETFLAPAANQQPGIPPQQTQNVNTDQGVVQPPVPIAGGSQGVAQSLVPVAGGQQGTPELTVTLGPADGSVEKSEDAVSHVQHGAKSGTTFSLCDVMPPPWNIICYIIEFIFFTWPMYYFWLFLIFLCILQQIYLAFKEILDPIIIVILDAIYLVVWCVVRTCQFIWMVIKSIAYPIKETILRWSDAIDGFMNPWKRRTPHTHVPGFSY